MPGRRRARFGSLIAGAVLLATLHSGVAPAAIRGPQAEGGLVVVEGPVEHLDGLAREPMIAQHPDGTLFVSGYGSSPIGEPYLWKSTDHGASWRRVDVGTTADGAVGNSDVDLAISADGTIYFVAMGFDADASEGTHVAIGVSDDVGESWSWTQLSRDRYDDRPWVEVAPEGTAHVIWNDGGGVCHAVSVDGGRTWNEHARVSRSGGSSHLAIGPAGELAVRITPLSASGQRYDAGVDLIAVSTDGGTTWRHGAAPGRRQWSSTFGDPSVVPRWVEPLAWDESGNLHYLWSEGRAMWLASSTDRGASWERRQIAVEEDTAFFPYLTAAGGMPAASSAPAASGVAATSGALAATWFVGDRQSLAYRVARIDPAARAGVAPQVLVSELLRPDTWLGGDARRPDTAGEYVPVMFLADGGLAVVSAIQSPQEGRFGFAWWRLAERIAVGR